jgi:hypothetical protein
MKNRIFKPFRFQIRDGEFCVPCSPLKEFPLPKKIRLDGREEKALAEAAGPAQKVGFAFVYKPVDIGGLVHIDIAFAAEILKILYAYGHLPYLHGKSII